MNINDLLKTLAPTVASALGGPLAGAAVTAISSIFGTSETADAVSEVLKNGSMTADQLSAIKQLELKYQNDEQERGFKYAELEYKKIELDAKDRDSAREREVGVKDSVNKVLAYTIVGSFIAMVGATLLGYAKVESVLAGTLVGYLSAKAEQVLAYYFGSSKSSDRKTEIIASSPSK